MAGNKTKETGASVEKFLSGVKDPTRQADCRTVAKLFEKVTKWPPRMWGPSIVGFGTYHYKYESGREGDACIIGFSSRKPDLTIYGMASSDKHPEIVAKLGKHTRGKGCLYIRTLADVNL